MLRKYATNYLRHGAEQIKDWSGPETHTTVAISRYLKKNIKIGQSHMERLILWLTLVASISLVTVTSGDFPSTIQFLYIKTSSVIFRKICSLLIEGECKFLAFTLAKNKTWNLEYFSWDLQLSHIHALLFPLLKSSLQRQSMYFTLRKILRERFLQILLSSSSEK